MKRLALFSMLLVLGACGISGTPERPPPLWNRAEAQAAEQRREEQERREREALRQHRVIPQSSTEPSPNQPPGSATTPQ